MGDLAEAKEIKKTLIVPAVEPFEHYDFNRAKICSSLTWLLARAFGTDSVPDDLTEPFYTDQYEQEHLKPPIANLLLSAELYCRAGNLVLERDAAKPLLGHDAVIQALAQKAYVTDQERLVTERDLRKRPIQMSAHLALIDALMTAYTVETVSVEKVVASVKQYCTVYPDGDVPCDTEDAITSWINKVNEYLKDIITQEQRRREKQSAEPSEGNEDIWFIASQARYRKEQALPKMEPWIPPVDNLLKDCTDGCALAALLHFYCPDIVRLEDIWLKETMSLADSLSNLQVVQDFCRENLNRCCHFTLEDMLYAPSSIKNNYLVFMAELFWWFEVVKPSFVQPRVLDVDGNEIISEKTAPLKRLPLRPQPQAKKSGEIKRSTSMSFVDGYLGTWPKEKRSCAQGVSFDIPFDKEGPCQAPTAPSRGMTRSASTEGLGFKVHHANRGMKRNLSFQPVNGQTVSIEEEGCPDSLAGAGPDRGPRGSHPRIPLGASNGLSSECHSNTTTAPSIEEALDIIHNSQKKQQNVQVEGTTQGFFLHLQNRSGLESKPLVEEAEVDSWSFKGGASTDTTEVDTGIQVRTEDIQETLDEDSSLKDYTVSMDLDTDQDYEARACRSQDTVSPSLSNVSGKSPGSGSTPSSYTPGVKMTSFAEQKFRKISSGSTGASTKTTADGTEFSAPHSVSWATTPEETSAPKDPAQAIAAEMVQLRMRLEEKRKAIEAQKKKVEAAFTRHRQKMGRSAFLTVVKRKDGAPSPVQEETPGHALQAGQTLGVEQGQGQHVKSPGGDEGTAEVDLAEYTHSIEKLNASLNFLQTEMQRLAQQQDVIMQMREQQQTWVVSPPQQKPLRGAGGTSASFHSKTPRAPRPNELKITPFNRVLTAPQSVDSLPRLRRFSPSQSQDSCMVYMGEKRKKPSGKGSASDGELLSPASPTKDTHRIPSATIVTEAGNGPGTEDQDTAGVQRRPGEEITPPVEATVSEVLSQAIMETFINLIEVPLSVLKPLDGHVLEDAGDKEGAAEGLDDEQKACCGFFFKDDMKEEKCMAVKRAALLEKRMRRERESQHRKQHLEAELEQKKEEARLKAEEERLKKEEEKARREFIKQEYLRRKQLKLMEDMDTVIKPRATSTKQRKPRPKSIHRDILESPKTPIRAAAVSSLSLASLNLGDKDSVQSDKRTPRPDSADGFLSPSRSGSRNGEKDWENGSTTSSVASNTEYTGPKLYKEPSAKSNKHIIQNALAHCCLAGKVNEGQKNKILEEMEKSEANSFLILFRDSGCQFRSLYTYCPESEEIAKLTGIGPKSVSRKMIDGLYKYNSDRKQFSQIPAKTMSASVDAITIHSHLWQTKKPGTPKKALPAKS
uniref:Uncharacterized protein n=1 Tax=Denticeps clupeoides TaxID=299321 RepID=A0AAY4EWX3_9TELE